jgi:hypothetical protein
MCLQHMYTEEKYLIVQLLTKYSQKHENKSKASVVYGKHAVSGYELISVQYQ